MKSLELGRRNFLWTLGGSLAASLLLRKEAKADAVPAPQSPRLAGVRPLGSFVPVQTPGVTSLPSKMDGGVREFHLVAQPVTIQFPDMSDGMGMKGRPINVWGYNGSMIGPTLEAVEGETLRVIFTNSLSEPTTVHFHGIELPIEMDGVPDFSQDPVQPG